MSRAFGRMRMVPVLADCARLYPQVELKVRRSDRRAGLVEDGVGVAIRIGQTTFALCGSPGSLTDGGLVRMLREYGMPPVPIGLVHLPIRPPSPAIQALVANCSRTMP